MIAAIPLDWGAETPGGTVHAWTFNTESEHGRRIGICEYVGTEERWTQPAFGGEPCEACLHRTMGASLLDLTPLLQYIARKYPCSVAVSELYSRFSYLNNRALRKVVFGLLVGIGLVSRITKPGYGERYLALRPLREATGIRRLRF